MHSHIYSFYSFHPDMAGLHILTVQFAKLGIHIIQIVHKEIITSDKEFLLSIQSNSAFLLQPLKISVKNLI